MYRKTMREALEEARSYRDPVNEDKGFSSQQIKMAYGVLNDPRYKQGNYSGAYKAIEKIARGLASHPDVANALKRANEELDNDDKETIKPIIKQLQKSVKAHDKQAKQLQKDIQDEVKLESAASDKAKGMGLDYLSFGRYGKGGKVTHKNIGGTLTAVDKDEKPVKEPEDKKDDDSKMPADVMKTFNDIKNFEITDNNAEQVEKLEKARDDFDDAGKEKYAAEIDSALEELMDDEPENADDILSDLKQKIKDDFNESVSAISIKLKEAFTKADFAKLESDNEHTEAAEKLINMFGTKEEKFKMAAIKARHNMTGYIKGPDYRERIRLVNKYYSRLKW